MEQWKEMLEFASDEQLVGLWENGVCMKNDEYMAFLDEVRSRNLMKRVFG